MFQLYLLIMNDRMANICLFMCYCSSKNCCHNLDLCSKIDWTTLYSSIHRENSFLSLPHSHPKFINWNYLLKSNKHVVYWLHCVCMCIYCIYVQVLIDWFVDFGFFYFSFAHCMQINYYMSGLCLFCIARGLHIATGLRQCWFFHTFSPACLAFNAWFFLWFKVCIRHCLGYVLFAALSAYLSPPIGFIKWRKEITEYPNKCL
jgi:hypothetical protein